MRVAFAIATALAAAVASVPEVLAHGWLFDEQIAGVSMTSHLTGVALVTLPYSFALTLIAVVVGCWEHTQYADSWRSMMPKREMS